MECRCRRRWCVRLGPTVTLILLVLSASVDAQTVGGRAFAAFVDAPTVGVGPLYLSDSGSLGSGGGWEGAGLLTTQLPGVLSATVLNAATSGGTSATGLTANSSSSLADVTVFPGQVAQLTASFILAEVASTAGGGAGTVQITNLTFGGAPIAVTGAPNQRLQIPGLLGPLATLTINEQTQSAGTMTVNAVHLVLATGDEVILGSAVSSVNPAGAATLLVMAPADRSCRTGQLRNAAWTSTADTATLMRVREEDQGCIDFVTGGGWFEPPNASQSGRVNFGFNAGPRSANNPDGLRGHINVVDHGPPMLHIRGINVTFYGQWGSREECRVFQGDAIVNGTPGFRYNATVCDYGEPGRDDRFMFEVFNGLGFYRLYDNRDGSKDPERGELDGGNIQLHKEKCVKPKRTSAPARPQQQSTRAA